MSRGNWRDRRRREQAGRRDTASLKEQTRGHWMRQPMTSAEKFAAYLKNGMKE